MCPCRAQGLLAKILTPFRPSERTTVKPTYFHFQHLSTIHICHIQPYVCLKLSFNAVKRHPSEPARLEKLLDPVIASCAERWVHSVCELLLLLPELHAVSACGAKSMASNKRPQGKSPGGPIAHVWDAKTFQWSTPAARTQLVVLSGEYHRSSQCFSMNLDGSEDSLARPLPMTWTKLPCMPETRGILGARATLLSAKAV